MEVNKDQYHPYKKKLSESVYTSFFLVARRLVMTHPSVRIESTETYYQKCFFLRGWKIEFWWYYGDRVTITCGEGKGDRYDFEVGDELPLLSLITSICTCDDDRTKKIIGAINLKSCTTA